MSKLTEFLRWYVPDERKPGKLRLTRYHMTREVPAELFPGAFPDPRSRETRDLPETAEEMRAYHAQPRQGGRAKEW
jgi:hypothetical protein